ncbi:MAG: 2-oxo-4-hydroxy-4-carboxy-5-ureidoimidazoline decarboxylase [Candidatus Obscuribacterales bacterium]
MSDTTAAAGGVSWLNALSEAQAVEELERCCGSKTWAAQMCARRPFADPEAVHSAADEIWSRASEADVLEALSHHPKIGDVSNLRAKFASTEKWAANEQSAVRQASDDVLHALHAGNVEYEAKFGFIFVVFATGKSADQMLAILQERLPNGREQELQNAAAEQRKITHNRLEKLWQQQHP